MAQTPWIEWTGGECPVEKGTSVEVRHRDGDELIERAGYGAAEDWSIEADEQHDGDIMAYRVVSA